MPIPGDADAVDYGRLIEDRRVHGSLYTDRQVFAVEIDRIFRRGWIFVGHESEIPKTGDWVTRRLGREPVIMLRAAEGGVHVLANRCAHRGTLLCWQDRGSGRKSFQCSYHGWVFGLDGKLRSLPGRSGFESPAGALDLARPEQVDAYRGFVFANQSGDAGPLEDHLGPGGRMLIDRAVELSPVGRLALGAGWIGQRVASNWKMWSESDNDGYHLAIAHASLQKAVPNGRFSDQFPRSGPTGVHPKRPLESRPRWSRPDNDPKSYSWYHRCAVEVQRGKAERNADAIKLVGGMTGGGTRSIHVDWMMRS